MKRTRAQNRGIALLIVLTVVGLAALIGMAMLSNASLNAEVSNSAANGAAADYMAESGLQTAAYFMQNPAKLQTAWNISTATYSVTGKTLPGAGGSFDLSVAATNKTDIYTVTSTGYSSAGSSPSRTETATMRINRKQPNYAGGFGGPITIASHYVFSNVIANGAVTNSGTVSGSIKQTIDTTDFSIPTASTSVNHYATYVLPDGTTGTADTLSAGTTMTSMPSATITNPGKVFVVPGSATFNVTGTLNFAGTLILNNGTLTVKRAAGTSATLAMSPLTGSQLPALICDGPLRLSGMSINFSVSGVVWANGTSFISAPNTADTFVISGALLMPAGATLGATTITPTINYDATKVNVASFTTAAQPVTGITLQTWSQ